MIIAVVLLSLGLIITLLFVLYSQLQLRHINRQLAKRLSEHTNQPISLQLMNAELNHLVANMNKCLKAEEMLRLESFQEEKRFKELISNISHDLRTPLTAIRGYQQLLEKGPLTEEQKQKLSLAQKHAKELERLIDQFFEYSYLTSAEPELHLEKINLTNLAIECIAMFVTQIEERQLSVSIEETGAVFVYADQEMCKRIVQNLVRNSIQHASGSIHVKLSVQQGYASLTFVNAVTNAANLEPDRLFDRFYTGSHHTSRKSTGLGLSIVRLLAEQMGGRASAVIKQSMLAVTVELPLS